MLKLFLLSAILAGASSGPVKNDRCSQECTETTKHGYQQGMTYEYNYEGQTITKLQGSSLEHAALFVRATAKFEVISKCEFALKLSGVVLEEADTRDLRRRMRVTGNDDFKRHLEAVAIKFSFQDGKISDVCASPYDKEWVINIKRGVISAFQNSMLHFDHDHSVPETDVSGKCEAHYKITRDGAEGKTFSKYKNLLGCMQRTKYMSAMKGTHYNADSGIQSLPFIKSFHDCEIIMDKTGILTKSQCNENHVLRPFSNDKSGASTKTQQTLTFANRKRGTPSANEDCSRRTTLLFEHNGTPEMIAAAEKVSEILTNVCNTYDVRPDTPAVFARLVHALRAMNKASIERLMATTHQEQRRCQAASKYLHDAIPMVGTAASVAIIRDSVLSGHVVDDEANSWLASLAFVSNVDKDMVMNVKPLLDRLDRQRAVLSASALVNSYCKYMNCQEDTDIKTMVKGVVALLPSTSDEQQKLIVLKAIANMGVHTDNINRVITEATNTENPTEVRVAAMHAFHKMCCMQSRQDFLPLFMNIEEDTEIRINAYLALMKCPNEDLLDRVLSVIDQEGVTHVSSFVVTHLNNLKESSDHFSQNVRKLLEGKDIKKKVESKKGMMSKNFEGSLFSDMLNLGGKADSNLIFSQKSYVPRSANLNLTVDLFGQTFNLLEVGGRVEGAESLMETLFGSDGYFPDSPFSEAVTEAQNSQGKRTALKGSMYMKMMGNELRYLQMGNEHVRSAENKFSLLDVVSALAKGTELQYDKNFMFMDTSYTLPTVVGLPIHMVVNGTASVRLGISGKLNMNSLDNIDLRGAIKPSAAIQVASMMMVDANVVKPGMKMVSTLHTSTQADVSFLMQNKQILRADIKMPKNKMEFVDAETKFFIMHQGKEREQSMMTEGRVDKEMCTGNILKKALGLQLCGKLSFRNATNMDAPGMLLTGPMVARAVLKKVDTHSGYSLHAQMRSFKPDRYGPAAGYVAHFSLDTPGSKVDRKMLFDFKVDKPSKTVDLKMASPWKKVAAHGSLVNTMDKKQVKADVTIDGEKKMALNAQVQISKEGETTKFTPSAELMLPGQKLITLQGLLINKPGEVNEGELRISNITANPILLKGSVTRDITSTLLRMDSTVEVSTPMASVKGSMFVEMEKGLLRTEADIVYGFGSQNRERLSFTGRMKNTKSRYAYRSVTNSELKMTQFPQYNWRVDVESALRDRVAKTTVDIRYSGDLSDQRKRIYFNHAGSYQKKGQIFQMNHEAQFTYKAFDLQFDGKLDHRNDNNEIKTTALFNYNDETANLNVDVKRVSQRPLKITSDISLSYPGREMRLRETLEQKSQTEFHQEFSFQWQRGMVVRSSADFTMVRGTYGLKGTIDLPDKNVVEFEGQITPNINDFLASAKVTHKNKVYSGIFKYSYSHMRSLTANFDLKYPQRHITSDLSYTSREKTYKVEFKTLWDADKNPNMKVVLDGTFRYLRGRELELTAVGTYIGYTGRLSLSHQQNNDNSIAHFKVFWAEKKGIEIDTKYKFRRNNNDANMEVEVSVKTPFQGFENQSGTLAYTRNGMNVQGRLSYTFRPGKTIVVDGNFALNNALSSLDTTITMTTPFTGYSNMVLKYNYNKQSDKIVSKLEFSRMGKKYEADLKYEQTANSMRSSLKMASPHKGFRSIELTAANELTRRNMKTVISGKIQRKAITLTWEGKYVSPQKMEGKITLETPFMENVVVHAKHNRNGGHAVTNGAVQWSNTDKIMVANDLKYTANGAELKFNLATPYDQVRSLDVSFTHSGYKRLPINTVVSITRNGQVTFNSRFQLSRVASLFTLDLTSPHVIPIRVSVTLDKANMPYTCNMMVNWQDKTITFEGDLTHNGPELAKSNMKLTTPFSPVKEITVKVNHNKVNNEWRTTIETTRERDNQVQISSTMSPVRANLQVQSTYPLMQKLQVNTRYASYLQSSLVMSHEAVYGKSDFELGIDCNMQTHKHSGFFKLDTPRVHDLFGKFSHETKNGDHLTKFEAGYKQQDIKLDATLNMDSPRFNAILTTPFGVLSKVTVDATHDGSFTSFTNDVNVMVRSNKNRIFKSKFTVSGFRAIQGNVQVDEFGTMTVSHRMTRAQMNSKVEMTVLAKKSDLDLQVTFGDIKGFTLKMNTPFAKFKSLDTSAQYERKGKAVKVNYDLDVQANSGKLVTWTSLFEVTRSMDVKLQFDLNSPLLKARRVAFTLNHDMAQIIHSTMRITYGNKMGSIETLLNMNGNFTMDVKTPFRGYQQIYLTSAYMKNGDAHTSRVILNYPNRKQINVEGLFSLKPVTLELAVQTPFDECKDASMKIKHVGSVNDFTSTLVIKHNMLEQDIEEKVVFKMNRRSVEFEKLLRSQFLTYQAMYKQKITRRDIDIKYEMTFTTPSIKDGKVAYTHKGLFDKFESEMEITADNKEYFDLEISFDIEEYKTKIEVETYHKLLKKAVLEFFHKGTNREFENELKLNYNDDEAKMSCNFKMDTKIEGKLVASAPFMKDLEATITHTGLTANFQHNTNVKYGNQVHAMTASLSVDNPVNALLQVRSPLMKNLDATFKHEGNAKKFNNNLKVNYGSHIFESINDMDMKKGECSFELKIPYQKIGNAHAVLSHNKVGGKMVTEASVTYSNNQVYKIKSTVQPSPVDVLIKLETPHAEARTAQLELKFTIDRSYTTFNLDTKLQLNQAQLMSLTANMNANTMEGRMTVQAPKGPLRQMDVNFKHEGKWNNFKSSAKAVADGTTYFDGDMTFQYERILQTEVKVKTASKYFREGGATLYYKMTKRICDVKAMASRNGRVIKAEVNLKMKPSYEFTGKLQTPYKYLKDLSMSVNHEPQAKRLISDMELKVQGMGIFKFNINLEMAQNVQGTLFLRTPMREIGDATLTFNHRGGLTNFNNSIRMETVKGNVVYNGEFRMTNGAVGKFSVTTPINQLRNTMLEFNVNPRVGSVMLKSGRMVDIKSKYSLRGSPTVSANIRVQTPYKYLENIEFNLSHQGTHTAFNSDMNLTYKQTRLISAQVQARKTPLYGNLVLSIYKLKDINVEFNHRGNLDNMQTVAKVTYGRHVGQATMTFTMQPVINGKLTFETPFHQPILFKLTHEGSILSFRNTLEGTYGSKTATVVTKLSYRGFSMEATTPVAGYENFNIELANNGDPLNFQVTAAVSFRYVNILKLTGEYKLTSNPRMGKIEIVVPANNILMTFKHDGSWTVFNNNLDLTYNGKKYIEYESSMSQRPFQRKLRIYTPLFDIGTIKTSIKHTGTWSNFQNILKYSRNSMRYQVDTTLETDSMVNLKIEVSTPFTSLNNLKAILTHSGPIYDFKNSFSVVLNSNEVYSLTTVNKLYPSLQFSIKIETPNYKFREGELAFALKGHIYKFFNTWAVKVNGESKALWQATFDAAKMEGSILYKMPHRDDIKGNFNVDGTLLNFTSTGEVSYGRKKAMASFELTTSPMFSVDADFSTTQ